MPRNSTTKSAAIRADVEVKTNIMGTVMATTSELSDSGAFIQSNILTELPPGTFITVQAIGFPEPMPVVEAVVVDVGKEGISIKFVM
ncbi:hypothetical protein [Pleionea sp. CnH1-48]|uniref:hypothetical protein n=1 Tax=Pleionea sp. CnH1-48 TaxID=2954494 RepID=UPI00209709CD|nr:hypothetical protein [Pleionea sp. CnH1-48]MCO7225315.1 hypothetical protein [Pleionea sp. CnH1-48]